MNAEFITALADLEKERGISKEFMIEAIEAALATAYKRDYGPDEDVRVHVDRTDGEVVIFRRLHIVDDVLEPAQEISLEEARAREPRADIGGILEEPVTPAGGFGRIAAQLAKQVVVQRIREAEHGMLTSAYLEKENEMLQAVVQNVDRSGVTVLLDNTRTMGIIYPAEQIPTEHYHVNDRMQVYVVEVHKGTKGPQVTVSRSHPNLVKRLFEREVPEIHAGTVLIKSIAREAGSRSKMAVFSKDEQIDAIGACVGQRGARVEAVKNELHGEHIDVIRWSSNPAEFIANALSPAHVLMVQVNEEEKAARVIVPDNQLSLAIGKEGQNARLAARLTGWKIDIKSQSQAMEMIREDD